MDTKAHEDALALAEMRQRVEAARRLLADLQDKVVQAEQLLGNHPGARLREANEQLVLAALQAHSDADAAVEALHQASRVAELDALTELPNRALLLDRLAHAIAGARRHGTRLALLFVDLDHFKQVNDTHGHAVGDQVLKRVAHDLAASVRASDTVSRRSGDEFLILLADVSQRADVVVIADKLIATLDGPPRPGDELPRPGASIGISLFPDDAQEPEALIALADAAMYRAKKQGRGRFAFHGESTTDAPAPPAAALDAPRHAQMREANEHLVLAALSAQVLQAGAEHRHEQQTRFLAVLAHELRNPLTVIRAASALLGRVRSEEPRLPRMRAIIEQQVVHMTRFVGDLLDVSRVSTGKLRLQPVAMDLASVIADVVEACRPAMDARGQRFELQVPEGPIELQGDPVRLTQVLNNLLDNASKYTPNGGKVGLTVESVAGTVELTVSDTGIGITAEALPDVFEPFVQDAHAVGFNGVGLGLGLTVVRELVEGHGGTVVVSSGGKGLGSRFVVTLPAPAQCGKT